MKCSKNRENMQHICKKIFKKLIIVTILYDVLRCTKLVFTKFYLTIYCVTVPPMLTISNQLVGGYIGQDIKLECHTEAFPTSINFWTTEKGDMIVSGKQ